MTARVWEDWDYQEGEETRTGDDTKVLRFVITGTDDYDEARTALESYFSVTHPDGQQLNKYKLRRRGDQLWKADLNYSEVITQSLSYSVKTTGATARITHGFNETKYGPAGVGDSNVPGFGGALNVQDGRVEGFDKVIPAMELRLRNQFDRDLLTDAYIDSLFNLTGTLNNATFANRPAETLLFLGAEVDQPASGDGTVDYFFLAGRHITGLTLGAISGISKKAHQYLWPLWDTFDDTDANRNGKRIAAVYVDDVAEAVSWAGMFPS
ncbi:hypothetical protein U8335_04085 [Roseiconus lacunae]|uniref:hypothetical protein n=1 Tax=Roseiconus lacunae TaxID=2605694 RepID=UPI00309266CB|nr:hypothetical protein U8335_04085 [Stieleria sp. HD01]